MKRPIIVEQDKTAKKTKSTVSKTLSQEELSDILLSLVSPFLPPKDFGKLKFLNRKIRDYRFFAIPNKQDPIQTKNFIENLIRGILIQDEDVRKEYLNRSNGTDYVKFDKTHPNFHHLDFLRLLINYKENTTPTKKEGDSLINKLHLLSLLDPAFCYNILAHAIPQETQTILIKTLFKQYNKTQRPPYFLHQFSHVSQSIYKLFIEIKKSLTPMQFHLAYVNFLENTSWNNYAFELFKQWVAHFSPMQIEQFFVFFSQSMSKYPLKSIAMLAYFYQYFTVTQQDIFIEQLKTIHYHKHFQANLLPMFAFLSSKKLLSLLKSQCINIAILDSNSSDNFKSLIPYLTFDDLNKFLSTYKFYTDFQDNDLAICFIKSLHPTTRQAALQQLVKLFFEFSKIYNNKIKNYQAINKIKTTQINNATLEITSIKTTFDKIAELFHLIAPTANKQEADFLISALMTILSNQLTLITRIQNFKINVLDPIYALKQHFTPQHLAMYIDILLQIPMQQYAAKKQSLNLLIELSDQLENTDLEKLSNSIITMLEEVVDRKRLTAIIPQTSYSYNITRKNDPFFDSVKDILGALASNNKFSQPLLANSAYFLLAALQHNFNENDKESQDTAQIARELLIIIAPFLKPEEINNFLNDITALLEKSLFNDFHLPVMLLAKLLDNPEFKKKDYSNNLSIIMKKLLVNIESGIVPDYYLLILPRITEVKNNPSLINILLENKIDDVLINFLSARINNKQCDRIDLRKFKCLKNIFPFLNNEKQTLVLNIVLQATTLILTTDFYQFLLSILNECAKHSTVPVPTPKKNIFGDHFSSLENTLITLLTTPPEDNISQNTLSFNLQ